jgi:hypothetical protein
MPIPKKPDNAKSPDDFLKGAKATQADSSKSNETKQRGRPTGPQKGPLPVRLPVELLEVIRENSGGNISFFTEKVFREYFERNDIKID